MNFHFWKNTTLLFYGRKKHDRCFAVTASEHMFQPKLPSESESPETFLFLKHGKIGFESEHHCCGLAHVCIKGSAHVATKAKPGSLWGKFNNKRVLFHSVLKIRFGGFGFRKQRLTQLSSKNWGFMQRRPQTGTSTLLTCHQWPSWC